MFDIVKMITIYLGHITANTNRKLIIEPYANTMSNLSVFDKSDYGYFIAFGNEDEPDWIDDDDTIPEDLKACIRFAMENDCNWLCLDCDGMDVDLPKYEW